MTATAMPAKKVTMPTLESLVATLITVMSPMTRSALN